MSDLIGVGDHAALSGFVASARDRKKPFTEPPAMVRFGVLGGTTDRRLGWEVLLSCADEGIADDEHWHLSAMLVPRGRGSTSKDWEILGRLLANVVAATGVQHEEKPKEWVPIAQNDPNAPHHFYWHLLPDMACAYDSFAPGDRQRLVETVRGS